MSTITYVNNFFSASSDASAMDDNLRDFWQDVALGTNGLMYWPGSNSSQGGSTSSTGEMLEGTAMLSETEVEPFNTRPDGTIIAYTPLGQNNGVRIQPNKGIALGVVNSGANFWYGNTNMETGNDPVSPVDDYATSRWLVQEGTVEFTRDETGPSDLLFDITFPEAYDAGAGPRIHLMMEVDENTSLAGNHSLVYGIGNVTESGFSSAVSQIGTSFGLSQVFLRWRSEATKSF